MVIPLIRDKLRRPPFDPDVSSALDSEDTNPTSTQTFPPLSKFIPPSQVRLNFILPILLLAVFFSTMTGALTAENTGATGLSASVNPLIGTGKGPGGGINLFPGASLPFGMVQLSPDTESKGYGYHYDQNTIQGFSMTHMSGVGCSNEGEVFFTPTTGPIQTQVSDFQSPYTHSQESAAPGYYQVKLSRWNVNAELTATDRTGMAQFTFPAGKPANILLPISHTLNDTQAAYIRVVGNRQIDGYVVNQVFCGDSNHQTYKVYFVMTFSRPFAKFGTWNGDQYGGPGKVAPGSRTATQTTHNQWIGAYATWPTVGHAQTVTAKVAISYVDPAGAENNLKAETADKSFSEIRRQGNEKWNKALGAIDVSGGTTSNRTVFYTALYHSLMMPSIISDADGRYLGFDDQIHHVASGHLVYANYSGWDIYRSEMPLLALIKPQRMEDMAQSVVLMYKQGGWIGRWPQINRYTNVMAGSPLTVVLSAAWLDGLHGFDIDSAWEGMLKDATQAPPTGKPYTGEEGIQWINQLHYVPNDKVKYGSVSQIQEDAIAYASLYHLAVNLGKTDDAKMLYQRALYYRNVFDPQDHFFRPRNADGQWTPHFDPARDQHGEAIRRQVDLLKPDRRQKMMQAGRQMRDMSLAQRQQFLQSSQVQHNFSSHEQDLLKSYSQMMIPTGFIEGSGWHYQWLAPEDMAWLIHAMGPTEFNKRLTQFFNYPKPGWYGQYYNPYNETDLEAPFEFNFSAQPWKTQQVVRRVLTENYTDDPNGVPGNDDAGEMSSWAVMSMMGIYSVDPASLAYELVSPVFPKIVVHLAAPYTGKAFTVETSPKPEANPYIQSVKLNGNPHQHNWIPYQDITGGGTLQFDLGPNPNQGWGSLGKDVPPSLSQEQP